MSDLRVNGLAELQRFLDQLPAKIERNIIRGALRQGANVIMKDARERAPKGSTRLLSKGLTTSTNVKGSTAYAYVKPRKQHGFLAYFFEYGVKPHSLKKGARRKTGKYQGQGRTHPGLSPQPFMRPAFDSQKEEAVIAVGEAIKKRLTKAGIDLPDINIGGDE